MGLSNIKTFLIRIFLVVPAGISMGLLPTMLISKQLLDLRVLKPGLALSMIGHDQLSDWPKIIWVQINPVQKLVVKDVVYWLDLLPDIK